MTPDALNYNAAANYDDGSCIASVVGCGDNLATNYDASVNLRDDSLCTYGVTGCTDSVSQSFFSQANVDDGSCVFGGCLLTSALNYDSLATYSLGLTACVIPIYGCTDSGSLNYFTDAEADDGSCQYAGCMDSLAINFDPLATMPESGAVLGGCDPLLPGCTFAESFNYNSLANTDDGSCDYGGCDDAGAPNYESWATYNDGSCDVGLGGCTDPEAVNYMSEATYDTGVCLRFGCTDSRSFNYDSKANNQGIVCVAINLGCTEPGADNYNVAANSDDGSCLYYGCADSTQLNFDPSATYQPVTGVYACTGQKWPGCTQSVAANYDPTANFDEGCIGLPPSAPPPPPSPPSPFAPLDYSNTVRSTLIMGVDTCPELEAALCPAHPQCQYGGYTSAFAYLYAAGTGNADITGDSLIVSFGCPDATRRQLSDTEARVVSADGSSADAAAVAESRRSLAVITPDSVLANVDIPVPAGMTREQLAQDLGAITAEEWSEALGVPVAAIIICLYNDQGVLLCNFPPPSLPPAPPPSPKAPPPSSPPAVNEGNNILMIVIIVVSVVAVIALLVVGGFVYNKLYRKKRQEQSAITPSTTAPPTVGADVAGERDGASVVEPPALPTNRAAPAVAETVE